MRNFLFISVLSLSLFSHAEITRSVSDLKWLPKEGVTIDGTLGKGDYGDVVPIKGPGIKENRVLKIFRWDLEDRREAGTGNISDKLLLKYVNGWELAAEALGDKAIHIDGVIDWNNGSKGIVMERLPLDAELHDLKNGIQRSSFVNEKTLQQFEEAVKALSSAHLYHSDLHMAILSDGSVKLYDLDLVTKDSRESASMEQSIRTARQQLQKVFMANKESCKNSLTKAGATP